jgi:hypothetical protein
MIAVLAALLRLRQSKSILITHQRFTSLSSDSSISRDSGYFLGICVYRGKDQKLERFDTVTTFLRIPPDQGHLRLGVGFSSSCAAVSFTPSKRCVSRSGYLFIFFRDVYC